MKAHIKRNQCFFQAFIVSRTKLKVLPKLLYAIFMPFQYRFDKKKNCLLNIGQSYIKQIENMYERKNDRN